MKIHHLNCTTFCPIGGRHAIGNDGQMVCHCLLIETAQGLVLVDTGLGLPTQLDRAFKTFLRPKLLRTDTAIGQLEALGFKPQDVRHILLTHMDLDHAGGLADFPHARVHLMRAEKEAALNAKTLFAKRRYPPYLWAHSPHWVSYDPKEGERWNGFQAVRQLDGLPPEILFIPLRGHTEGHAGIAVQTGQGWLLHAGDAYFHHAEIRGKGCPAVLEVAQRIFEVDRAERMGNQSRLRQLASDPYIRVFCAHDSQELSEMTLAHPLSIG